MKKKILALTLILPIVFMLALFSVGKIASIIVNIPVSGINITTQNTDGFIEIDAANYADDLIIEARVEPLNATNKRYGFSIAGVNGAEPADISVDENGRVSINGLGSAKITVTSAENSFTDSVIITAFSSSVLSLIPKISDIAGNRQDTVLENGAYSAELESGVYNFSAAAYPSSFSSNVSWRSENENILEINPVTGKAKAKLSGTTGVTVSCSGESSSVSARINVTVERRETESGITVNGLDSPSIACARTAASVNLLIDRAPGVERELQITGTGAYYLSEKQITDINENQSLLELFFSAGHPDEMDIKISAGGGTNNIKLNFSEYAFNVYTSYHLSGDKAMYQTRGSQIIYVADAEPFDSGVSYEWLSTEGVLKLNPSQNGSSCTITADALGKDTVIVRASKNGAVISTILKTVTVIKPVYSVDFTDNAKTYGIENMLSVADTQMKNGRRVAYTPELALRIRTDGDAYDGKLSSDFKLSSSDTKIFSAFATEDSAGLDILSSGISTISIEWKYSQYFGTDIKASITLRAVKDGTLVNNYEDLTSAAENGYKIVLGDDIMLGREGARGDELKSFAKSTPTDYDWQFYKNRGLARPSVLYLVEFKNDVYGNGHFINGDYITKAEDGAGNPLLFRGPLDFVSISTAAVKAQDNAVFLVRTAGVTIDNVVLKGCSDESIVDEAGMDLTGLNNVGTTLEIAADCKVLNSRINNGRTCVRVFGGKTTDGNPIVSSADKLDAAKERVCVKIESCVLTNAREFILKIGTNRAVLSTVDKNGGFAPAKFKKADGSYYSQFDEANATDDYFYKHYVLTDVTLKNSVLATSGLFSIGLGTHFSGEALAGTSSLNLTNWKDMACTSFASALRFEGDVRLLDWKELDKLDSSTLIESTDDAQTFLKLDIAAMLTKVNSVRDDYKTIVSDIDGKKYVHGGIARFGGGHNYSYLDSSACTSEALKKFKINLSVLAQGETEGDLYMQGTLLPVAAGLEDFVFYMYDSQSENDYAHQQNENQSGIVIPPAVF